MSTGARLRAWGTAVRLVGMRDASLAVVVLALAGALGAPAADETPARVVEYGNDTLTVRLVKAPVGEVLDAIARQSGAEIRGEVREPREVSADFEAVPLPEALHRLLGRQNFALVYGDGGRLRVVKLLGGPLAPGAPPSVVAAPVVATSTTQPPGINLTGMLERAVPVSGRLSEVFGSPTATFRQLMDVGLRNEDATVRAEALRVGIQALEAAPELRSTVIAAMNGMDEAALSAMLRGAAGAHAEEVAMHIATQAQAFELRAKASAILQRLRSGG